MTKDEALDLALEALEKLWLLGDQAGAIANPAIKAIKQARALDKKAENARELGLDYEPVGQYSDIVSDGGFDPRNKFDTTPPAAPVQEPVAFFDPQGKGFYWAKPTKIIAPVTVDVKPLPLYTTPPNVATPPAAQRQWVGLTETEVDECYESVIFNPNIEPTRVLVYQAIEAKLKEKNNG
jgi:hypothetical protein